MKKFILSFVLMAGIGFCLSAQTRTPRATKRQMNQQARIAQGMQSGQLTPEEARALEQQQAKIQQDKKAAKSDGVVTPEERARIHREQKRASKTIYLEKHDGQKR